MKRDGEKRTGQRPRSARLCFSPRPPAGGDEAPLLDTEKQLVSIHAPRAGGDENAVNTVISGTVSIHAPRAGGDFGVAARGRAFVSIHAPRAGGDIGAWSLSMKPTCFNPRPPRGGRPPCKSWPLRSAGFNPRPPARGATKPCDHSWRVDTVSIHAPRAGGDQLQCAQLRIASGFNPRPPRGGRPARLSVFILLTGF